MGASFEYEEYGKMEKDELKRRFNSDVEEDLHMHGHSYSGGIGMLGGISTWLDTEFTSVENAVDYICDNQNKWDGAMAARLTDGSWVVGGWCSS